MTRQLGPHGLNLIKSFEWFCPWVYDDKCPMLRMPDGKFQYAEWQGGPVAGTLTIGYGHTDVAKHPLKCTLGTRITESMACEVLDVDLSECIEQVNTKVKVPLTQGQFDALVSFTFNCGVGNLERLIIPLNRGDYDVTRGDLSHYVRSKGQVMRGLERRRAAEQTLWDDSYDALPGMLPSQTFPCPHPNDVDPRPESNAQSHVAPTSIIVGAGAAAEAASHVNDTLNTVKQVDSTFTDLLTQLVASPRLIIALAILGAAVFLWWQRSKK